MGKFPRYIGSMPWLSWFPAVRQERVSPSCDRGVGGSPGECGGLTAVLLVFQARVRDRRVLGLRVRNSKTDDSGRQMHHIVRLHGEITVEERKTTGIIPIVPLVTVTRFMVMATMWLRTERTH